MELQNAVIICKQNSCLPSYQVLGTFVGKHTRLIVFTCSVTTRAIDTVRTIAKNEYLIGCQGT